MVLGVVLPPLFDIMSGAKRPPAPCSQNIINHYFVKKAFLYFLGVILPVSNNTPFYLPQFPVCSYSLLMMAATLL